MRTDLDPSCFDSDLKRSRDRLLELLPDPHHTTEQLETALKLYACVFRGLLEAKDPKR